MSWNEIKKKKRKRKKRGNEKRKKRELYENYSSLYPGNFDLLEFSSEKNNNA